MTRFPCIPPGGFYQLHDAVLIAEIKMSVGVSDGSGTGGALGPNIASPAHFAGHEFEADGKSIVVAVTRVEIVAEQDESAVVILKGGRVQEINLLCVDAIGGGLKLQQGGAGSVSRRGEDEIPAHDGSRDIRDVIGDAVVAPQDLAVARANSEQAAARKLYVLADAGAFRYDDGRISCSVASRGSDAGAALGSPDFITGPFVHGGHESSETAGSEQELVAIDRGRLGELPVGHHAAPKIARHGFLPLQRAGRRVEADHLALGTDRVNVRSIDGRGSAGTGCVGVLRPRRADFRGPDLFPIGKVQCENELAIAAVAHSVDTIAGDCET